MINDLGVTIEVVRNGLSYHTIRDWELTVTNNDYIGEPEQETNYIDVPGRNGFIDASETVSGRRIFKSRVIRIELGGIRKRLTWDTVISTFRNKIHGETVHLTFDNDISHYWVGRCYIEDFDRARKVGTFVLTIPYAEPYKYNIEQSSEPWKWDPFSFVDGIALNLGDLVINGQQSVTIPSGNMEVSPTFIVSRLSGVLTMTDGENTYALTSGSNRFPDLFVNGDSEVALTFTGSATVSIVYRGGSL